MTTIQVEGLGKAYGDAVILENTSLSVRPGEAVAFMSPSGSGKSTLLSMLGLLLTPTAGSIKLDGREVLGLPDAELSELRLRTFGFIFQHTQLVGSLRALENVLVPARFAKGVAGAEQRARALLEGLGLGERLYHYPHQLSIGQKRRVAMARALLLKPPVLIADEPTNDLDAASCQGVADALFAHAREGGVLLFATHDEALAARADRIMRLRGRTFVEEP